MEGYEALIDEYIENSNKFPYMYESIRESIKEYLDSPYWCYLSNEGRIVADSIYVPYGKNTGEHIYMPILESMISWDESELTKWLLKEACLEYFYALAQYGPWYVPENIQKNLPVWDYGFLDYEDDRTFDKIKDFFPSRMSEKQIRNTIRTAYEDARKDSKRQMPTLKDLKNVGFTHYSRPTLYKGQAKGMVIHFWFNFYENRIEMAYPADVSENNKQRKRGNSR